MVSLITPSKSKVDLKLNNLAPDSYFFISYTQCSPKPIHPTPEYLSNLSLFSIPPTTVPVHGTILFLYVYVCVCVYIHTHMYITHIYTYICIYTCLLGLITTPVHPVLPPMDHSLHCSWSEVGNNFPLPLNCTP